MALLGQHSRSGVREVSEPPERLSNVGRERMAEHLNVAWTAQRIANAEGAEVWQAVVNGRTLDVRVAPGLENCLTVERAVEDALGAAPAARRPKPRYRIDVSDYAHGDLFELEQDTIWTVVLVATGRPLWEFRGGTSHDFRGGTWSPAKGSHGVDEVVLGADGLHVLVRNSGTVTCYRLPPSRLPPPRKQPAPTQSGS